MKNKDLTNVVYNDVKNRILNFLLMPGVKVSDKEIAEQMGISRSPVRQALFRLSEQGLVQSKPNKGFWVKVYTSKELKDLVIFREALETKAIELAINHCTEKDIISLEQGVEDYLLSIDENDIRKLTKVDWDFHSKIAELSCNELMISFLRSLQDRIQISFPHFHYPSSALRLTYKEHKRIVNYMLKKNIPAAKKALSKHILGGLADRLKAINSFQE